MVANSKIKGVRAEQQARQFLENHGLKTVAANYRCRHGEIDLIMQDTQELVFVEVRSRKPQDHGSALDSIDQRKINKIILTAEHYLQIYDINSITFCRFDVIAIDNKNGEDVINWLQNAFEQRG